ncbi:MAG: DUF3820 family protein [Deltaproteobacteria bacterium]|nr:DUF3820 family protein [Deltaproteobacteria bacterium]
MCHISHITLGVAGRGTLLIDLPEPYVVWFKRQSFPKGKLGSLQETSTKIKVNGLEPLVRKLK